MNGQAKDLSDRNTFLICFTDEHGSGLEENVRLCSPMFAYVRLCSLNGKKMLRALRTATSGRFRIAQFQIADFRLQIGQHRTSDCGLQNARQMDHGGSS